MSLPRGIPVEIERILEIGPAPRRAAAAPRAKKKAAKKKR
jgi:hypothetical protein